MSLPPLELGDGGDGTFLETSFRIEDNAIRHWLKNVNSPGQPPTVWRYAHFDSHADFTQKRATLMACLRKVHNMASDAAMLRDSAARKLFEFAAFTRRWASVGLPAQASLDRVHDARGRDARPHLVPGARGTPLRLGRYVPEHPAHTPCFPTAFLDS